MYDPEPNDWISQRRQKHNAHVGQVMDAKHRENRKRQRKEQFRFWLPIIISVAALIMALLK